MLLIGRVINHHQLSSARDGFSITWTPKSPLGTFLLSVPWLRQKLWREREVDTQQSLVMVLVVFTALSLGSNGESPLRFGR